MLSILSLGIYAAALAVAATSDLVRYEIPDAVSLALIAAFGLLTPTLSLSDSALHIASGLTVFSAAALLFAAGLCGGGDVKLLGATALWTGWHSLPTFLLLTALAGAGLALTLIVARRLTARRPDLKAGRWYSRLLSDSEGVPYGVAIAAAGLTLLSQLPALALPSSALS